MGIKVAGFVVRLWGERVCGMNVFFSGVFHNCQGQLTGKRNCCVMIHQVVALFSLLASVLTGYSALSSMGVYQHLCHPEWLLQQSLHCQQLKPDEQWDAQYPLYGSHISPKGKPCSLVHSSPPPRPGLCKPSATCRRSR